MAPRRALLKKTYIATEFRFFWIERVLPFDSVNSKVLELEKE